MVIVLLMAAEAVAGVPVVVEVVAEDAAALVVIAAPAVVEIAVLAETRAAGLKDCFRIESNAAKPRKTAALLRSKSLN